MGFLLPHPSLNCFRLIRSILRYCQYRDILVLSQSLWTTAIPVCCQMTLTGSKYNSHLCSFMYNCHLLTMPSQAHWEPLFQRERLRLRENHTRSQCQSNTGNFPDLFTSKTILWFVSPAFLEWIVGRWCGMFKWKDIRKVITS